MDQTAKFVTCPECGHRQLDGGKNAPCEECGYAPMPYYDEEGVLHE